jgi:hypothetical protein
MKKAALVAFNGDSTCFAHVLLNALDMKRRGYEVKVVIEGSATRQVAELVDQSKAFAGLYAQVKDAGMIDGVCRACATKMGAIDAAKEQHLPIKWDMAGHPALAPLMEEGYEIITF